jgi:phosphoglycolate phosphatase
MVVRSHTPACLPPLNEPTSAMTIQLAVFDFDGTLADTWPVFISSLGILAAKHGFRDVKHDEAQRLRRLSAVEILRELELPLWRVPAVLSDFRRIVHERVDEVHPFAGITEALHTLADSQTALAVATSNSVANVCAVLGRSLVSRFIAVECGSPLLGKSRRLRQILKNAEISHANAIYIGDEIRDAEAAAEVGMRFGAVAWGYTDLSALIGRAPDEIFHTPADVARLRRG